MQLIHRTLLHVSSNSFPLKVENALGTKLRWRRKELAVYLEDASNSLIFDEM